MDVQLWIEHDVDDPDQALPFVDVVVGGRSIRALLDSGAGRTTVVPPRDALVERKPAEGTGVFGGAGERLVWRSTVELGGHQIGPIELDTQGLGEGRELIGQDVLSRFRCEFRFDDGLLRLDGPRPENASPIFLDRGRHVYVNVVWSAVTASAVLDTGASLCVVDQTFAEAHPELFTMRGRDRGTDVSGTTLDTDLVLMRGPRILGRDLGSTTAAVVDLAAVNRDLERPMDLIIGWPILRQANWVIDHADGLAALTA